MASYRLVFRQSVAKDMRAFPKKDVARILERITALAADPRAACCGKLSGRERYRVRQERYRIVYEIVDRGLVVVVVKVDQRQDVQGRNRKSVEAGGLK